MRNLKKDVLPLILPFLRKGRTSFEYTLFDEVFFSTRPSSNFDLKSCEGKVVTETKEVFIIKVGRSSEFVGVAKSLASQTPKVGQFVRVTPYARRYFDGFRLDSPVQGGFLLMGAAVKIPVQISDSSQILKHMVDILESHYSGDGYRRIAEMLVDAQAEDFKVNDSDELPCISFKVTTQDYIGRLTLSYNDDEDWFELHKEATADSIEDTRRELLPQDIGPALSAWLDDGRWKQVNIEIIK